MLLPVCDELLWLLCLPIKTLKHLKKCKRSFWIQVKMSLDKTLNPKLLLVRMFTLGMCLLNVNVWVPTGLKLYQGISDIFPPAFRRGGID